MSNFKAKGRILLKKGQKNRIHIQSLSYISGFIIQYICYTNINKI